MIKKAFDKSYLFRSELKSSSLKAVKVVSRNRFQIKLLKFDGLRWVLHKNDPDDIFPSCPHLDCMDKALKLNIYNGNIYSSKTKMLVGKIKKKQLNDTIWQDEIVVRRIIDIRERYEEKRNRAPSRYPQLPCIDEFICCRYNRNSMIGEKDILDNGDMVIIFSGEGYVSKYL